MQYLLLYNFNTIQNSMSKYISDLKIKQVVSCEEAKILYEKERSGLKAYLASIRKLKKRVKENGDVLKQLSNKLFKLHKKQSSTKKVFSEIQYYMLHGVKVFMSLQEETFVKSADKYRQCYKNICDLQKSAIKTLSQSGKEYRKQNKIYESQIKKYVKQCYVGSSLKQLISFTFGCYSMKNSKKKTCTYAEKNFLQSVKKFTYFIKTKTNEIEDVQDKIQKISMRNVWISQSNQFINNISNLGVNSQQLRQMGEKAKETKQTQSSVYTKIDKKQSKKGKIDKKTIEPKTIISHSQEDNQSTVKESVYVSKTKKKQSKTTADKSIVRYKSQHQAEQDQNGNQDQDKADGDQQGQTQNRCEDDQNNQQEQEEGYGSSSER